MASLRNVYTAFVFIAFGGLLFGYIIGINGNVVTSGQLTCSDSWSGPVGTWTSYGFRQCYQLSALQKGVFSSLNLIGACLSSLICFRFADSLGRKLEVQLGALLYFAGAVVAALSPTLWGIYAGFTIYGFGIGFAMHAAPVYIAEISPAAVRGSLVSAKEAVVVTGIFLGFFCGYALSGLESVGWRYMVAVSGVFALIMEIGITVVPQSPRYILLRAVRDSGLRGPDSRLLEEAGLALQYFRAAASLSEVAEELEEMRQDIASVVGREPAKCTAACGYPRQLFIGCGLVFLQQVTGQPSVLYFATDIFKSAGFGGASAFSPVIVGAMKLIATLFTVWRVDNYGRRKLLFAGILMMTVALIAVGVCFSFRECETPGTSVRDCEPAQLSLPRPAALVTVAGLMLYVSGYQVGFGPIAWLMISEVFPLQVRGAALSLAAIVNFGSNISMTLVQETLLDLLTPSGVFLIYAALCVASLAFVHFVVPETKGQTLEQIEAMLSRSKDPRRLQLLEERRASASASA